MEVASEDRTDRANSDTKSDQRKALNDRQKTRDDQQILPKPSAMLLENASIHHHEHSSLTRLLRRDFIDHVFLQPDHGNLQPNRLLHNLIHILGSPEYIHQIDRLRHFEWHFE